MVREVRMPQLGAAMESGEIVEWLKSEGDTIELGAELVEIMTDKAAAVITAPIAGILGRILASPGAEVPVGGLVALIGDPGDDFE